MAEFRYPDGFWPRPIKKVAAAIYCIDGTTSEKQANTSIMPMSITMKACMKRHHSLQCQWVTCSWLASTKEELAYRIRGHKKFNLLNRDESFDGLYALLRGAQPPSRPPPGFRPSERLSTSSRPHPSPRPRPSPRKLAEPLPRIGPSKLGPRLNPRVSRKVAKPSPGLKP